MKLKIQQLSLWTAVI